MKPTSDRATTAENVENCILKVCVERSVVAGKDRCEVRQKMASLASSSCRVTWRGSNSHREVVNSYK